ncbi:Interleukin-17F [Merluccius polli]|uniref:Interleukin-17F n=1 Tax=Merluccius polli TaxID=89951 RepID=A0AA47MJG7_MERPO|nr:Interleukin-17F [Merluccius polli]
MANRQHGAVSDRCQSVLTFSSEHPAVTIANGNIHTRSLSPWTWRNISAVTFILLAFSVSRPTTVAHRIPSTIWEAECNGSYCSVASQPDGARSNAVPIHQSILVVNRRQGENCYVASYQTVSVGCTCVQPEIL